MLPRRKHSFGLPDYLFKCSDHPYTSDPESPWTDAVLQEEQNKSKELLDKLYPAQALFQATHEILGKSDSVSRELGKTKRVLLEITREAPAALKKQFPNHIWVRAEADYLGYPFNAESLYVGTDQFSTKEPTFADFTLEGEVELGLNGETHEITDAIRQIVEFAGSST